MHDWAESSLFTRDTVVNPKQMRWGICTQEICFKNPFLQVGHFSFLVGLGIED